MTVGRPSSTPSTVAAVPSASSPTSAALRAPSTLEISSEALFAGASEVQITHRGSLYRLKQTALGKLILTK